MIVVCEPLCKAHSHEKVNAGFLETLRAAYPDEPIRLYCDPSHAAALRALLAHDGVEIADLEQRDFPVVDTYTLRGVARLYRALARMLGEVVDAGAGQVLFLAGNPIVHHLVKRLHARAPLRALRFAFVLHSDFEDVANERFVEPIPPAVVPQRSLRDKVTSTRPRELPGKVYAVLRHHVHERYAGLWKARFREREQLLWRHSPAYRYIALSPHVVRNAARHLDVGALGIRAFHMPIHFAPVRPAPRNSHLKLAVFGYGDVTALGRVARALAERRPSRPYEIRVIGMDTRGLDGIPGVTLPSPGRLLERAEMERLADDIDAFLILYGRGRYNLSCSGSIFEAFSYVKPVVHLGNACVAEFDRPEAPIGFGHEDLEGLTVTLADMIEHPERFAASLELRRANLLRLRERLAIPALAPVLRQILSFA